MPTTLYAVPSSGGVFKSTNGGASWTASNTGLPPNTGAWALAIDPVTPTTLYAGTGSAVFKSADGGASWTTSSTALTNTNVMGLAIDPTSPPTLYTGAFDDGVLT